MNLPLILVVGIDNNAEEEKRKEKINQRHQKLRKNSKSGKPRCHTKFTIYHRDYTGEEENLTVALYNGTHNNVIYSCFIAHNLMMEHPFYKKN